jgi:hypothetical protein
MKIESYQVNNIERDEKPYHHCDHQDSEYLPYLSEITNKGHASRLIERVKLATRSLESALKLTLLKKEMWHQLKKEFDRPVKVESEQVFDFEKHQKIVEKIATAYAANNPYLAMQKLSRDLDFKDILPAVEMDTYSTIFDIKEKIKAVLTGKSKKLENEQNSAIKMAESIAIRIVSAYLTDHIPGHLRSEINILMFAFSQSDACNMDSAGKRLFDAIKQLKINTEKAKGMALIVHSLKEHQIYGSLKHQIDSAINSLDNLIQNMSIDMNLIAGLDKPYWGHFSNEKVRILNDLKSLMPNPDVRNTTADNCYFLTREFDESVKELNGLLDEVGSELFDDNNKFYYRSYAQLSKTISSGRLLTHSAPTDLMYLILEDGVLRSAHETKKNKGSVKRTHDKMISDEWCETHEICFSPNDIYSNFRNTPLSNIALLFSENVLLSENRPFVEYDGIHVYDEKFRGGGHDVPGLNLDMKKTPCMIMVVDGEKDRFLRFLVEQSAWKKELSEMNAQEKQSWIENNVIFVDRLDIDENVKRVFNEKKKPVIKEGHVEITYIRGLMKISSMQLQKFIPRHVNGRS